MRGDPGATPCTERARYPDLYEQRERQRRDGNKWRADAAQSAAGEERDRAPSPVRVALALRPAADRERDRCPARKAGSADRDDAHKRVTRCAATPIDAAPVLLA